MGKKHLFSTKSDKKKKGGKYVWIHSYGRGEKRQGKDRQRKRKSFYRNLEWRRKIR